MDVTNLATSIVALYTTCREGYNFFTSVKTADTDSAAHLRELEIQQSILKAWGFLGRFKMKAATSRNTPITPDESRPNFTSTS